MSLQKIVIAANFTIEPIASSVETLLEKLRLEHELAFAPYNQIFQQLLDPASLFNTNTKGVNAIFLRIEDLIDTKAAVEGFGESELNSIRSNASELGDILQEAKKFLVPLFIFLCPPSNRVINDFRSEAEITRVAASLLATAESTSNVYFFATTDLLNRYSVTTYNNPKGDKIGHIPFTDEFFDALGAELVRKIDTFLRKPHKVVVLDCDNTLWDGVCGEDGTNGISFSEPRLHLQRFMVEQSSAGMLIGICSKNNEPDVWEVFEKRKEMPLRRDHVVASRINWAPKSANLRSLAEELSLGLDSFIFIDDDSTVCAEVRTNCPEVMTIQIPEALEELPKLLEHTWVFDRLKVTKEDRERTASYRSQVERNSLQAQAAGLTAFLESLQLVCEIKDITSETIDRVSQLSLRTNQFNSTTIRRSEADIRALVHEERAHIKTIRVKDRFGDYGLVGVVIFKVNSDSLDIDSFMLSCRVLGRGVEHTILRDLAREAVDLGKEFLDIQYGPTAKNIPFLNFIEEISEKDTIAEDDPVIYRISVQTAINLKPRDEAPTLAIPAKNIKAVDVSQNGDRGVDREVYIEIAKYFVQEKSQKSKEANLNVARTSLGTEFIAAQTETEFRLKAIWEKLLKVSDIGVADDFFELGGDSLVAVSLFVEIENQLGVDLPLSALINSPTIKSLAGVIDQDSILQEWKYLVPIQTEGSRTPLFCFHAAGGNVLFYRDLANELGGDQPVYGLQARGISDKRETAHDRVEDMAVEYLKEIRLVQPKGPYRLCGSSFGGLVAFEAAQQLRSNGEDVEILGLFDTYAPGFLETVPSEPSQFPLDGVMLRLKNLANQLKAISTAREQISFIRSRTRKLLNRTMRKVIWKKNEFALKYNAATGRELPPDIQRNHKAIDRALKTYRPDSYPGDFILFRATDQPKNLAVDPYLGWRKFAAGAIEVREVSGSHGALTVYPFATELAGKFENFLTVAKS